MARKSKDAKGSRNATPETPAEVKPRVHRPWGGSLYQRADRPGSWWARWIDSTGKRRVKNTETGDKVAAERLLARWTGEVAADEERGVRAVTARAFIAGEFLPVLRARVVAAHADNVASHLLGPLAGAPKSKDETDTQRDERRKGGFAEFLGVLPLYACGTDKVEQFLATLRQGKGAVSPATVARVAASLSGMFRAAVDANAATENPVRRARLPRTQQYEPHALTPADVDRIIDRAQEHARPALVLLADLGLRLGELLRLTWQHVAEDGSQIIVATSKSGRTRAVPVPSRAKTLLAEMRKARALPLRGTDFVLARPRSKSRLQRLFREAAKAAGLPVTPDSLVGVRVHDLRHAYASALARNGVALSIVASLIGDSLQVTGTRYARHVPLNAAVLAVASLERPASTAKSVPTAQAAG